MSGNKPRQENAKKKEVDCNCYADSRTEETCPPILNVTHPLRYYEFTQEEMRALEECDKESFFQRCLPLSTLFATVTYAAIRAGYMQRSPHFGVYPKMLVGTILGYFFGRAAYIDQCEIKLREKLSEDSHLGNVMRRYNAERNPPPKKN